MAWSGEINIDSFTNTLLVTPEVADVGDGIQTVFALQTVKKPIFIEGVEIEFTIGAAVKTVTSDSSGDFSAHADITSGTITEAGLLSITFATAPDDLIDILFNLYTTKGYLEKIIEYITTNQFTEIIDTGDDIKTVFSNTLANTTIASGQMLLRFRIGSVVSWVWDNGIDFVHPDIASSTIDYGTGAVSITFSTPIDTGFAVDILYTTGAPGQDWIILHEELAQDNHQTTPTDAFPGLLLKQYVLTNSGGAYTDRFVFGLRESRYLPSNQFNLTMMIYEQWEENESILNLWSITGVSFSTTYDSTREHFTNVPCIAVNDDAQKLWISSTKDRLNVACRVSGTVYTGIAAGIGKRFGASKTEYQKPYYISGAGNGNLVFSSTSSSHIMQIGHVTSAGHLIINPLGIFQQGDDFRIAPTEFSVNPGDLKKTTNNKVPLYELMIEEFDPAPRRALYEIPGWKYCPYIDMSAEDTLDDGGSTWFVIQDIFRTDFQNFYCMEQI